MIIEVENVWKSYRAYEERASSLKETILKRRSRYHEFWALKGVSFELGRGEMLGVIGSNGSGKSTLLKCLARIIAPNYGTVSVGGKVSALLELGTGFHQELTGRENVYLAGSILGQSKVQIAERFDDIVAFSGLGDFIDSPVKNYSSGMYARLAFSVAINVDPEVLLIDEVLAVGDEQFQAKCHERLFEFRREGVPIVFVSHALDPIRNMCSKVMWLDQGQVRMFGDPQKVVDGYLDEVRRKTVAERGGEPNPKGERFGTGEVKITGVEFLDADGESRYIFTPSDQMTLRFRLDAAEPTEDVVLGFSIERADGEGLCGINTQTNHFTLKLDAGESYVDYRINALPLWKSSYRINAIVHDKTGDPVYDARTGEFGFSVMEGSLGHGQGLVYLPGEWDLEGLR